jgi:hypothetical protein
MLESKLVWFLSAGIPAGTAVLIAADNWDMRVLVIAVAALLTDGFIAYRAFVKQPPS